MKIQGTEFRSRFAGTEITTRGVVTLETESGGSFWIQDPSGDGDPATSDGIYVYEGERAGNVRVGDLIEITADVEEWVPRASPASQPITELVSPTRISVLASNQRLPQPVAITDLPNQSIAEALLLWESVEGMRVRLTDGVVVSPTTRFGEFALVVAADATSGSGFFPEVSRLVVGVRDDGTVDYNPERVIVDDGSLEEAPIVVPGTRIAEIVGVVDYSFGNYKVQPERITFAGPSDLDRGAGGEEVAGGEARAGGEEGHDATMLSIVSFNAENLFDRSNNPLKDDSRSTPSPRELEVKLEKLVRAVRDLLELPEIIVVQETENEEILQTVGDLVDDLVGTTDYVARSFESSDGRGIENAFLYDTSRVTLVESWQLEGEDVDAAFGPDSPSPGREPIVGVFDVGPPLFPSSADSRFITIVGNHFKSKGGDEPIYGVNRPPNRPTEEQRRDQATVVRRFVDSIFAEDPESLVIVAGDMNDFQFGEPGEPEDHPLAILESTQPRMRNVVDEMPPAERHSYVYDGNSQVLDHLLVSPALEPFVADAEFLRGNAGSPAALSADGSTFRRSSDHDPLRIRLKSID